MQAYQARTLAADWCLAKAAYTSGAAADSPAAGGAPTATAPQPGSAANKQAKAGAAAANDQQASDSSDDTAMELGADAPASIAAVADAEESDAEDASVAKGAADGSASPLDGLAAHKEDQHAEGAPVTAHERTILAKVLHGVVSAADEQHAAQNAQAAKLGQKRQRSSTQAAAEALAKHATSTEPQPAAQNEEWQGPESHMADGATAAATAPGRGKGSSGASASAGKQNVQVFIRNVPLDASTVELQAQLQRFGDVKACRYALAAAAGLLCSDHAQLQRFDIHG